MAGLKGSNSVTPLPFFFCSQHRTHGWNGNGDVRGEMMAGLKGSNSVTPLPIFFCSCAIKQGESAGMAMKG